MLYQYGVAQTIHFPLVKVGTNALATSSDYTYAAGDFKISKDGAASVNPSNSPTFVTMGNGGYWKLTLTATELEAKTVVVTCVDSATKAVEDLIIVIDTYGGSTARVDTTVFADTLLNRDMSAVSSTNARSPLNAFRFLRNKWTVSGGTLTVYEEDDTATAWTSTLSTAASADAITGSDPA
jgi:hypothetical protein